MSNDPNETETIQIVDENPLNQWAPTPGAQLNQVLDDQKKLPPSEKQKVERESVQILSKCVPAHSANGRETGIVVGYVQSGKTLSFTSVAALAKDNGYHMVILIAGTSKYLVGQSKSRLDKDLGLLSDSGRSWQHFSNPRADNNTIQNIRQRIEAWRDDSLPPFLKAGVLITVMKNANWLDHLIDLLTHLGNTMNNVPTLIIDDEADQAGLNTQVKNGLWSPIYSRLLRLRQLLPHHTFLQYTATPQAPLLINLIDILSPKFVHVLYPGSDYVGGRDFFIERRDLIRGIPTSEIPSKDNPIKVPPASLQEALRLFFLGVSAGILIDQADKGNRSMMVHPSQLTAPHDKYFDWVQSIKGRWEKTLRHPASDPDRQELRIEFQRSYEDLKSTVPDIPDFDRIFKLIPHCLGTTQISQLNSRRARAANVDWRQTHPHILVGGQAMDRGFTVEGLTVTYMPRGRGVGQADTIQQRARFFGYKRKYLGFCRVFLEQNVLDAYTAYVDHEEDMRERLIKHSGSGKSLADWRRAFFLDTSLQPTRSSVLSLDYMRGLIRDEWFSPRVPHYGENIDSNRLIVTAFMEGIEFRDDTGHKDRTQQQKHKFNDRVRLDKAYKELLAQMIFSQPQDSQKYMGLLLQLERYLKENPDALCSVYVMSNYQARERSGESADKDGRNKEWQLFQGPYPDKRGEIYPGDRHIRSEENLTIQIHNLTIREGKGKRAKLVAENVPTLAVWVPQPMGRAWLVGNRTTK